MCFVVFSITFCTGRGNDYVDQNATGYLRIEACHRRQCFCVGIMDSNQVEEEESFDISLFRNGLNSHIKIGRWSNTTVTILDDDSKLEILMCCHMTNGVPSTAAVFGLTQPEYRVEEGQTLTATVCVGLLEESGDCVVPFPIHVIFNTRDGSGKNGNKRLCGHYFGHLHGSHHNLPIFSSFT